MKTKHSTLIISVIAMSAARSVFAGPTLTVLVSGIGISNAQSLVVDPSGNIYVGSTAAGGGLGTVVELSGPNHQTMTTLANLDSGVTAITADPTGDLFVASEFGGIPHVGTVIELSGTNHQTQSTLVTFASASTSAEDPTTLTFSGSTLYGTASTSGRGSGAVFTLSGPGYQTLTTAFLSYATQSSPTGAAVDASGNVFGADFSNGSIFAQPANLTQHATTLVNFNTSTGIYPHSGPTIDAAGNLYEALYNGGTSNDGTIIELSGTNHQTLNVLANFNGSNGSDPFGGLIIDNNGNLFGTTRGGGLYGQGTIFELSGPNHNILTTLASYQNSDGTEFTSTLAFDSAGNLYGIASALPTGDVFELTNSGFAVPEPSGISLLAMSGIALLRRRRR